MVFLIILCYCFENIRLICRLIDRSFCFLLLFGFEGRMWDFIVLVPAHCLSFYFKF